MIRSLFRIARHYIHEKEEGLLCLNRSMVIYLHSVLGITPGCQPGASSAVDLSRGVFTYVMGRVSTPFPVAGAEYSATIARHETGQASTQALQTTQRKRSIVHSFAERSMSIA
jgi:hypothetical protein